MDSTISRSIWLHARCLYPGAIRLGQGTCATFNLVRMQGFNGATRELCELLAADKLRVSVTGQIEIDLSQTDAAAQPALIQDELPDLAAALQHVPPTHILLRQWRRTPAVAQAAAAALAPAFAAGHRATMDGWKGPLTDELVSMVRGCAPLQFDLRLAEPLTDELLSTVLQLGGQVRHLEVDGMRLQSDQHANAPWPWAELSSYDTMSITDLCKLPNPSSAYKRRVVNTSYLDCQSALPEV